MANYISLNKEKSKKNKDVDIDYKSFHRFDKFYSDVKFYKTPIKIK